MMSASMSLTLKDGRTVLQIEPMEIETKTEAKAVAAMIEKWAEGLPDKKGRSRAKPKSSRRIATSKPSRSRSRRPSGDTEAEEAEA
jgi:hypothetical protein